MKKTPHRDSADTRDLESKEAEACIRGLEEQLRVAKAAAAEKKAKKPGKMKVFFGRAKPVVKKFLFRPVAKKFLLIAIWPVIGLLCLSGIIAAISACSSNVQKFNRQATVNVKQGIEAWQEKFDMPGDTECTFKFNGWLLERRRGPSTCSIFHESRSVVQIRCSIKKAKCYCLAHCPKNMKVKKKK